MSIDNQSLPVPSIPFVSANIQILSFSGDGVTSFSEYTTGPKLFDRRIDPTLYEPLVNAWMQQAIPLWNTIDAPTALWQAKQIKIGYTEAIFHHKRQLPYLYGGWNWRATDEAIADIMAQIDGWDVAGEVTNQVNGITISTNTNTTANLGTYYTVPSDGIGGMPNGYHVMLQATAAYQVPVNAASASTSSKTPINVVGPSVALFSTAPSAESGHTVAMTYGRTVLGGVSLRRRGLNDTRIAKINAINAQTTILNVIAQSATSGWPDVTLPIVTPGSWGPVGPGDYNITIPSLYNLFNVDVTAGGGGGAADGFGSPNGQPGDYSYFNAPVQIMAHGGGGGIQNPTPPYYTDGTPGGGSGGTIHVGGGGYGGASAFGGNGGAGGRVTRTYAVVTGGSPPPGAPAFGTTIAVHVGAGGAGGTGSGGNGQPGGNGYAAFSWS